LFQLEPLRQVLMLLLVVQVSFQVFFELLQ
jgi:hypothetical protein